MKPQIIGAYDGGAHNDDLKAADARLDRSAVYKDLSTVIIVPAHDRVPTKAVAAWWNLMTPPNQPWAEFDVPEELKQGGDQGDAEDDAKIWLGKCSDIAMKELARIVEDLREGQERLI
jgi:hypothetical protein